MAKLFRSILVGVDLTRAVDFSLAHLDMIVREAVDWGLELAQENAAKITFFTALNLNEDSLRYLEGGERQRLQHDASQAALGLLQQLVKKAEQQGLEAQAKCAAGRGWLEIVREVIRYQHDLVVVGTRDLTGWRRIRFGNTAMKLFRVCPCPVLVTKTGSRARLLKVLVATDLKSTSEMALRFGVGLAHDSDAQLHVLHVLDFPLDRIWCDAFQSAANLEYHSKVHAEANDMLQSQLRHVAAQKLGNRVHVHLVEGIGPVDATIQHYIAAHGVQLLVMGTIGRTGLSGAMIGNTAERLLPEVHCSVLAVKPADFLCPIQV